MSTQRIWKYLASQEDLEQTHSEIRKEAAALREDIEFFSLYAKRNKATDFQFDIIPSKGLCRKFLRDMFADNYKYHLEDLHELLIECRVLKYTMELASDRLYAFCQKEQIADVFAYFKNSYDKDIRNYVGDFLSSSNRCMKALENITAVAQEFKLDRTEEQESNKEVLAFIEQMKAELQLPPIVWEYIDKMATKKEHAAEQVADEPERD